MKTEVANLFFADLYHVYRDHTFFQYEVVITRDDEEAGILGERYILSVSSP